MVGEIDYNALGKSFDSGVRLLDEALQAFRMPVVAAGLPRIGIHALLYDGPLTIVGDNKSMQI